MDDARRFLSRSDRRWDVIAVDTYFDVGIPSTLTTRVFVQLVHERLAPAGVVVVNVTDDYAPDALLVPRRRSASSRRRCTIPAMAAPAALHFTGDAEADALIARDPLALLIGFALDQQVPVQTAFAGPLKLRQRLGTLDAATIAGADPGRLEAAFRERPAIHRFPGAMAQRVQELCAHVVSEHGGDAARVWTEAADGADLRRRIAALPGFGEMKVKALGSVLAKRFGVAVARELVPAHPTLGDVDSPQALAEYQAQKRAHKAALRAARA